MFNVHQQQQQQHCIIRKGRRNTHKTLKQLKDKKLGPLFLSFFSSSLFMEQRNFCFHGPAALSQPF